MGVSAGGLRELALIQAGKSSRRTFDRAASARSSTGPGTRMLRPAVLDRCSRRSRRPISEDARRRRDHRSRLSCLFGTDASGVDLPCGLDAAPNTQDIQGTRGGGCDGSQSQHGHHPHLVSSYCGSQFSEVRPGAHLIRAQDHALRHQDSRGRVLRRVRRVRCLQLGSERPSGGPTPVNKIEYPEGAKTIGWSFDDQSRPVWCRYAVAGGSVTENGQAQGFTAEAICYIDGDGVLMAWGLVRPNRESVAQDPTPETAV